MTDARDPKASNPKEAFGSTKAPVGLVPDTAIIEESMAFLEGALKYGRFNWRIAGVKASTYHDAIERHTKKWWNGQDRDPLTRVRELASIRACCGILIDAEILGMLNDDRPPRAPVGELLDSVVGHVAHLKELFAEHSPRQYTWEDDPSDPEARAAANGGAAPAEAPEPTAITSGLPCVVQHMAICRCDRCEAMRPPVVQSAYAVERAAEVPAGTGPKDTSGRTYGDLRGTFSEQTGPQFDPAD